MRTPEAVNWDHEVVYECIWSLLVTIDNHNAAAATTGDPLINKVIVPGLGTGVGAISPEKCAVQMALALKHYHDAVSDPDRWSNLQWDQIYDAADEVMATRPL